MKSKQRHKTLIRCHKLQLQRCCLCHRQSGRTA